VTTPQWRSTQAWRDLLAGLAELDQGFLAGPKALHDEQSVAEGYRFLLSVLGVAADTYLFADRTRPVFVDINTPTRRDRRWGGDNTDAYYAMAPIDPARTYRVSGQRGDSTYFSLTVYNEPSPGAWSDRIVGIVNDTDLDLDPVDGTFSFLLGPHRPAGHDGAFIQLTDDAAVAVTRDYQVEPDHGRRVTWSIEALDPPGELRHGDPDTAEALVSVLAWVKTMFDIVPLALAPRDETTLGHNSPQVANQFAEPYQVLDANYGWSARDACYAFASFDLEPDEALVITHRPPDCRFWNLTIWNPFMAGHSLGDAAVSVNGGSAVPNTDGSVTAVIARRPLGHPNALSTVDHAQGALAFRWFLAAAVPDRPQVEVVHVDDAPTEVS
jgi:Protein of unknown function (DUF1214)